MKLMWVELGSVSKSATSIQRTTASSRHGAMPCACPETGAGTPDVYLGQRTIRLDVVQLIQIRHLQHRRCLCAEVPPPLTAWGR